MAKNVPRPTVAKKQSATNKITKKKTAFPLVSKGKEAIKKKHSKTRNPRLVIEAVALASTFLIFALLMLRIEGPQVVFGISFPNGFFKLLAIISGFLWIFFSISLIKIDLIGKYEKLFMTPPATKTKYILWFIYLAIFYMAVMLNFVDALANNISNINQTLFKNLGALGGFLWVVFITVVLIFHSVKGKREKK
jgi:hypothetical protein